MTMNKRLIPVGLAILLAAGPASGFAWAEKNENKDDAGMLADAKITLQQAIATAETQTGGRATSADLRRKKGVVQIEVETAGPQGAKKVLVNAQTGQVTATKAADKDDEDND